jgi:hypothetical protein
MVDTNRKWLVFMRGEPLPNEPKIVKTTIFTASSQILALSPQLVTCAIPGLVYYIGSGVEQFSSV